MKEQLEKLHSIISSAQKQIASARREIKTIQAKCPHKNLSHHRQEYVGRWSDCKDCGKEDV